MRTFILSCALALGSLSTFAQGYQFTDVVKVPATPVKNQASTGTCWCFATTSFMESELLRMGKGTYDLSEMFIVRQKYMNKDTGYKVFPVKPSEEVIVEMSRFFIYVFKEKDDADIFGFMVDQYINKTSTIPSGQRFWTEFRGVIEEAVNYSKVNNIDFNMKTLDMAYNTNIKKKNSKSKRDRNAEGIQRVKEEQIYI